MKRALFLLVLAIAAAYHIFQDDHFQAMLEGLNQQQVDQDKISTSRTSLGYILTKDNWIEFPLPPNIERMKLVTQASIPETLAGEDALFRYALEYEIVGKKDGSPLFRDTYHHTTRVTRFMDEKTGEPYTASLYIDPTLIPADGRILSLNKENWSLNQDARSIRVRLAEEQNGLPDVLLRVYQLERTVQPEDLTNWHRLSIYKRERMARGNVYPHGFLSDDEKSNLLNNRWRPLGPIGITGIDYQVRRLYTLKEISDSLIAGSEQEIQPDLAMNRAITVPISEGGLQLRITFTRVPGYHYQDKEPVEMKWYGSTITERAQKQFLMGSGIRTVVTTGLDQGLLELRSSAPYFIDFEQQQEGTWSVWQPERIYANTYLCADTEPLTFNLAHYNSRQTPIRITVRGLLADLDSNDFNVSYELSGSTDHRGNLTVPASPSIFDSIIHRGTSSSVTDPSAYYFQVPTMFEAITFIASRPVLISVATRSPNLPHRVRVPGDVGNYSLSDPNRMSAWFPLRPVNHAELYKNQKTRLVLIQQRPPVDDQDLLQGNYLYESLRPSLKWTGRNLLLPPVQQIPLRAPNPRSLYHLLVPGRSNLEFHTSEMLQTIRPHLVYINEGKEPTEITLIVDGNHFFSARLLGQNGRVQLPPLPVGEHDLVIHAHPDTKLLMNCLKLRKPGHLLRFANHLSRSNLTFEYKKTGYERDRLSFLFFSSSIIEATKLRIQLENTEPSEMPSVSTHFTLTDRRFVINPSETAPVSIINDGSARLGDGQRFLFPIGEDIPPGTYRIVVNLEDGPEGYLILSRVQPGRFSYRMLAKEPVNMETSNDPNG